MALVAFKSSGGRNRHWGAGPYRLKKALHKDISQCSMLLLSGCAMSTEVIVFRSGVQSREMQKPLLLLMLLGIGMALVDAAPKSDPNQKCDKPNERLWQCAPYQNVCLVK
ncbi:hypothetical protein GCK32_001403 [Trichostrongylus colubriformis]|uniref:Uncharacterized protein n=1 Tax=Trichostrongylus colubriformis TaxID=6319 RepID=A0AAN8ICL6_TRICO